MTTRRVDLAILGGGCAGLSLATRLARATDPPRTVVLEAREAYTSDRTWCYWEPLAHPFAHLVEHRWNRWGLRRPDRREVTLDGGEYPYAQLDSGAVYAHAAETLGRSEQVELALGAGVREVRAEGRSTRIETERGVWVAERVIDTRPQRAAADRARLLQHFVGWEVELEADAFDPERALLMDFAVRQDRGVHFVYLLPTSPRRALVETTYFSGATFGDACYDEDLRQYLDGLAAGVGYAVLRRERGVLPMDTRMPDPRHARRLGTGGIAGGALRPATGYAFHNIQAWADAEASRLSGQRAAKRSSSPRLLRPMDAVFLAFLRERPDLAPTAFAALFERVAPAALARFLSDRPRASDLWAVVRALPVEPLTRASLRVLRGAA